MTGLERGLQVLGVAAEHGPLTVDAIADLVGLPVSTAYRYVAILRSLGYLSRADGRYDVGARTLGLLRRGNVEAAMGRLATPMLVDLAERTGETVLLTVPVGWTATCVASANPGGRVRPVHRPGAVAPLHIGASAKPLLAHLPDRIVGDYLRFIAPTSAPGTGPEGLRRQLAEIRRTGVCVTVGEPEPDGLGIGVPVFSARRIAGCLSVTGHRSHFPGKQIMAAGRQLRQSAEAVERAWAVGPTAPAAGEVGGSIQNRDGM
jgi:DNA-binding IclR family transcriptional regulator